MRVSEMMSVNLVASSPDETIGDASRRMNEARVGAVLVRDGAALVGLLTERDVLRLVAERGDPERVLVAERMTREIVSVPPDAQAADVAELMNAHRIRHMPVTDGDVPVGMVSLRDFFVMSGAILRAQGPDAAGRLLRAAT